MPYQHWSSFHEVGLHGGSFDAVGAGLVGMPGLLFGRNRDLAWGITNNICSLRDLYQERPVGGSRRRARIRVRRPVAEAATVTHGARSRSVGRMPWSSTVVRTRNGPIVDALLPPLARDTGPVSMRWLGTEVCDWTAALLRLDRAATVRDGIGRLRRLAGADVQPAAWATPRGTSATSPRGASRCGPSRPARTGPAGTRRTGGWASIPPDGMPRAIAPAQGWLGSANNRPAPDDYPYPLSGTWDEGLRQRRIGRPHRGGRRRTAAGWALDAMTRMHADVRSLRAEETLPALLALFEAVADERARPALAVLRGWDGESRTDSAGAADLPGARLPMGAGRGPRTDPGRATGRLPRELVHGPGLLMLSGDPLGWFAEGRREAAARVALDEALDELEAALGPDPATWTWGAHPPAAAPSPAVRARRARAAVRQGSRAGPR